VSVHDAHEQELVTAALAGDRDAFGQLVDRYKRIVFSIALRHLRNEDEAMDLVQDTFLKAWTKLDSFQPDSNFKAWICRIAANGSIDRLRRNRTRRADEIDERIGEDQLAEGRVPSIGTWGRTSPLAETELGVLGRRLLEALDTLPEAHRLCVLLCDVHGYSYQEIADELDIPKGTVMSRLFYARKKLQVLLEDYRDEATRA
jgi:RNA polymerase sigma-70 factor (ECF subfamily)